MSERLLKAWGNSDETDGTYGGEFLEFDKVSPKLSTRPDLHAFLLLDSMFPGMTTDMISGASHDEIWLDVDAEALASIATDEQLRDLCRCGVRYDEENDSLVMFV